MSNSNQNTPSKGNGEYGMDNDSAVKKPKKGKFHNKNS